MLPMKLAQFRETIVKPAITKDSKITPGVSFPLEDGTVSVSFNTKAPVDLHDNAALSALPVKGVKEQVKTDFSVKTQSYTKLNPKVIGPKVLLMLDQADTLAGIDVPNRQSAAPAAKS